MDRRSHSCTIPVDDNVSNLVTLQRDYLTSVGKRAYVCSALRDIKLPHFVREKGYRSAEKSIVQPASVEAVATMAARTAKDDHLSISSESQPSFSSISDTKTQPRSEGGINFTIRPATSENEFTPPDSSSRSSIKSSHELEENQAQTGFEKSNLIGQSQPPGTESDSLEKDTYHQSWPHSGNNSSIMFTPISSKHSSTQINTAQLSNGTLAVDSSSTSVPKWTEEKERILTAPYDYLFCHPGKDIRKQMIAGFNEWLKVPKQSLDLITNVVGMLHTSSLLIDDVEDSSLLRRGIPVAHSIFGHAQTINSANYVYFKALQEVQKLKNPDAINIFTNELLNLHRGQGMDLYWRDTLTCPTEEEYMEMVANKTGGLFRLAVKLMQAESSSTINCIPLVDTIGMLFQVLDDYHNLSSPTYTAHKGLAEDLTEGKFSFLIIHAIRASSLSSSSQEVLVAANGGDGAVSPPPPPPPPSQSSLPPSFGINGVGTIASSGKEFVGIGGSTNNVLINILRQKTNDVELKKWAVDYMRRMGSFRYARAWITALRNKALQLVSEIEGRGLGSEPNGEPKDESSRKGNEEGNSTGHSYGRKETGGINGLRRIVCMMKVDDTGEGEEEKGGGGRESLLKEQEEVNDKMEVLSNLYSPSSPSSSLS